MEKEVLKSNRSYTYTVGDILGRCWVLFAKDYVRGKPKGADMKHVYVCEQRYTDQGKSISKIKTWRDKVPELELYNTPLTIKYVPSVFAKEAAVVGVVSSKKRKMGEDENGVDSPATNGKV
jgi:hypothetical protein